MSSKTVRYSEAFKRQVIEELENGRFSSPFEVSRIYGIRGGSTVSRWVQQYGKAHLLRKVVRVEKTGEVSELKRQKERIRQLEALVADLTMDCGLERATVELLCEQQGIDAEGFKKKVAANVSRKHISGGKGFEG